MFRILRLALLAACISPAAAQPATAPHAMIAAADPRAVDAGLAMLHAGGSAADAAIAAELVLTLVEPSASGIGGGAFLLYYDAVAKQVRAYDGRETAPADAGPNLFLDAGGKPMRFFDAVVGGRSVGTPGLVRLAELIHRRHGKLPWADLFQPAIRLAEQGFIVSPRFARLLVQDTHLPKQPAAAAYFYPDGHALEAGALVRNPAFAETLRLIAEQGADAFYRGPVATDIAVAVHRTGNPGLLTPADLAAYEAREREPVCRPYRRWRVCGVPPPSAGGIAVLQILGMLERFDLTRLKPNSAPAIHLLAEAQALAYADRDRWLADPDYGPVAVQGLLDRHYLAARSVLIDPARTGRAMAGTPVQKSGLQDGLQPALAFPSTSQISVVDEQGNAVSMTSSIENGFGSRQFVRGFLLNNELTDFAAQPERDGIPAPNRVQGGKRPRSSMAPTLVFDADGRLVLIIGSQGGGAIIAYVAQAIVAALDWHLDIAAAINLPHVIKFNTTLELEAGPEQAALAEQLRGLGQQVNVGPVDSGMQGIMRVPQGWSGAGDFRREGAAQGY